MFYLVRTAPTFSLSMAKASFSFSAASGCCSLTGSLCSFGGSFFAVTGDLDLDLLSLGRRSDMFFLVSHTISTNRGAHAQ